MSEDYESIISAFHDDEANSRYEKSKEYSAALEESLKEKSTPDESIPEGYKQSDDPENISGIAPLSPGPQRWKRNEGGAPEPER